MARDTKVGLLAGLAFIICFAILLANRGRQDSPATPRSYLTDGGANVPGAVQQTASREAVNPSELARRSPNGRLTPPAAPPPEAAVTRLDRPTSNLPATSGAELPLAESSVGRPSPMGSNLVDRDTNAERQSAERALTSRTQDELTPRQELERRLGISGSDSTATGDVNPQLGLRPKPAMPSGRQASAAKSLSYTVVPGDTLSKIAMTHFGNKSRSSVNAIFEANRSALTSPDDLQAGMVLTLPAVEGTARLVKSAPPRANTQKSSQNAQKSSQTEETKSRTPKKSAEPPPAAYRWYQVKKNDRYASIAREQLGDTGRWPELYELNKDKFPNPQSIREGVRIRLPAAKVLAAAEGRR